MDFHLFFPWYPYDIHLFVALQWMGLQLSFRTRWSLARASSTLAATAAVARFGNQGRGQAGLAGSEKVIPSGNLKYGKRNPPFEELISTFKTPWIFIDFPIVVHGFPMIFLSKPPFHWGISSHLSFPEGEQIPRRRPSSLGLRLVDLVVFFGGGS